MQHWWCRRHERVETDEQRCGAAHVHGPYDTAEEARAYAQVAESRTDAWESADEAWEAWPDERDAGA